MKVQIEQIIDIQLSIFSEVILLGAFRLKEKVPTNIYFSFDDNVVKVK